MIDHAPEALLVGESRETQQLVMLIGKLGPTALSIWIEGETGVGKERAAMLVHAASRRRGAFVAVNACAIPDSMIESTFFGHVRGAFTGAHESSIGLFEEANEGTLFLDEVSALPVVAQAKLLRAIETRRFRPVGARSDRVSNVRVVAASNEPCESLVRSGRLRRDFAFRLRGGVVHIPPLRDRPSDVAPLARHFVGLEKSGEPRTIDPRALDWLSARQWLGNVRELRQVVSCAGALSQRQHIRLEDVVSAARMLDVDPISATSAASRDDAREELLAELDRYDWDTEKVAAALSVDRTTVYRRMRKHSISPHGRH